MPKNKIEIYTSNIINYTVQSSVRSYCFLKKSLMTVSVAV